MMVKQIITEPGRTFSEFCLLPAYTAKDCTIQDTTLATDLAGLRLRIPMLSAAMGSVTGYEMALALGKEGGIGVLPARLPPSVQSDIIRRIKNYEMGFVEEPITVRDTSTVECALRAIEKHGHSKVPVVDRNNVFRGMFTLQRYWETGADMRAAVTTAMVSIGDAPSINEPDISFERAKQLLDDKQANYLVVLDSGNRLVKLAFRKDITNILVGAAISTHPGWKERVHAIVEAGVDLIVIDTSDGFNEFTKDALTEYKRMATGVPICAGNIVTYDGAIFLMEAGADMVKVGMSSGSICITQREKAVGRSPMTALIEACRARDDFRKRSGRYVPIIMDGGISSAADMIIALTLADGIMMGGYFNKFYEAAAEKLDRKGRETWEEHEMCHVATWGEGSQRAQNFARYEQTRKTFFAEGVEGVVPFAGRLKPTLKKDLQKIRAALSNCGCQNLEELRNQAVLELISPHASAIISRSHNMKEKE